MSEELYAMTDNGPLGKSGSRGFKSRPWHCFLLLLIESNAGDEI